MKVSNDLLIVLGLLGLFVVLSWRSLKPIEGIDVLSIVPPGAAGTGVAGTYISPHFVRGPWKKIVDE